MVKPDRTRTGVIIQARMDSSRLPGKVLAPLPLGTGIPVVQHIVGRAEKIAQIDEIIVATSENEKDGELADYCAAHHISCFRGSEDDVLERYCQAAREYELGTILRLTGDNPCIDVEVMNKILRRHLRSSNHYTSSSGFPVGATGAVISREALEKAHLTARSPYEREHVVPYLLNNPAGFRTERVKAALPPSAKDIRLTLDTQLDYVFLSAVFDYLYAGDPFFGIETVMQLLDAHPWLGQINNTVTQKRQFGSLQEEVKESLRMLEQWEFYHTRDFLIKHVKS